MIVTCCNGSGNAGIYRVDTQTGTVDRVSNMESRGITRVGDHYYIASGRGQNKRRGIHIFDLSFNEVHRILDERDWHGLAADDDFIYAVDAAKGEIVRFDHNLLQIDVINHELPSLINDLCIFGGRIFATMFDAGIIEINADGFSVVTKPEVGAKQAHSLICPHDVMLWCNSDHGSIMRGDQEIHRHAGYTRGLLVDQDRIWFGTSVNRKSGRGECLICVVDGKTPPIPIPSPEIYALAL